MRIACILLAGFEDQEFRGPYDRYRDSGHTVTVIGHQAGEVLLGRHARERAVAALGIDEASPEAFDEVFIPGGAPSSTLNEDERFLRFIRRVLGRPGTVS